MNKSYKHGGSVGGKKTPEYSTWILMFTRCNNPNNPRYKYYGERGIKVCDRWKDYLLFLGDMGDRPSKKHSLDRIDNNKGYSPENCRWATIYQQANNTSRTRKIEYKGVILSVSQWAAIAGMHNVVLTNRLNRGWEIERALFTSVATKKYKGIRRQEILFRYLASGEEKTLLEMKVKANIVSPKVILSKLRKLGCHIVPRCIGKSSEGGRLFGYTMLSYPVSMDRKAA